MAFSKKSLIQIAVSGLIFIVLLATVRVSDFSDVLLKLTLTKAAIITIVLVLSIIVRALRWQILMNKETKGKGVSLYNSTRFLLVGAALNIIMPAGTGDIAKSYFGYKWTGIKEKMVAISLFDKVIAISSISFMGIFSISQTGNYWFTLAILAALAPFIALYLFKYYSDKGILKKLLDFLTERFKRLDFNNLLPHLNFSFGLMASSFTLSLLGWLTTYLLLFYCFEMVGFPINVYQVMVMAPVLTLARLFPFTFNGLGSDEALIVILFSQNGEGKETILIAALLFRLITMILPAIFGVFIILSTRSMKMGENA